MKRRLGMWLLGGFLTCAALAWIGLQQVSLRALDQPGRAEIYLATTAKRLVIGREARGLRRPPSSLPQSVLVGEMQFRARCASCHGLDGHSPTDLGSAMFPRASDLGSAAVQQWPDAELFWIIQNGIRHTGMPGFGRELSEGEIWPLVDYVRSVGRPEGAKTHPR